MTQTPKHIAILTGGPSAERGIALASAKFVAQHLDPMLYRSKTIVLEDHGWIEQETGQDIDLNDFSLKEGFDTVRFDFVFLMIHGTPAEDGKIQGYFEVLGIPYSTCDTLTSSLTFNKQWCKDFLSHFAIPMAWSVVIESEQISVTDVSKYTYPLFVKPNNNGSSYGVSRVNHAHEMPAALENAARYDHEIIVESFIEGREFSCGAVRENDRIHVFPITEIISKNAFFDYQAKYEGASQEVTPAQLDDTLTSQCQEVSRKIYEILKCRGLVRCDYILKDGTFYLLEVNTIPGLSPASIVPQQANAYGWSMEHMLEVVIEDCMNRN